MGTRELAKGLRAARAHYDKVAKRPAPKPMENFSSSDVEDAKPAPAAPKKD